VNGPHSDDRRADGLALAVVSRKDVDHGIRRVFFRPFQARNNLYFRSAGPPRDSRVIALAGKLPTTRAGYAEFNKPLHGTAVSETERSGHESSRETTRCMHPSLSVAAETGRGAAAAGLRVGSGAEAYDALGCSLILPFTRCITYPQTRTQACSEQVFGTRLAAVVSHLTCLLVLNVSTCL
jgi:hypothetical protein